MVSSNDDFLCFRRSTNNYGDTELRLFVVSYLDLRLWEERTPKIAITKELLLLIEG